MRTYRLPRISIVSGHASDWINPYASSTSLSAMWIKSSSRFSISCRQIGPISAVLTKLRDEEKVYSENTSLFFKHAHVFRAVDRKRNSLVYVAISDRVIDGSPYNALSTVPVMP